MSFDLCVWYSPRALNSAEAGEIYLALAEGTELSPEAAVGPSPLLQNFLDALDARYPNLDTLSEDETGNSPWASGFESSDRHILLNIRWSAPDEVVLTVAQLAADHGLVLYDPQGDEVHLPPGMRARSRGWRLWPL